MMAEAAKKRHGTTPEPSGSPVRLVSSSTDLPVPSLNLTPRFEVAAELIISMVQMYLNEADKAFDDKDFQPLFAEDALGQVRMIPHRWTLLIETIKKSVSFAIEDPDFPLEFFITEMQQLSLSTKVTKFLADLLLRIPNVAITNNLRAGTSTIMDPTADRKARVTISVSLLQYDGSKGHAAKY